MATPTAAPEAPTDTVEPTTPDTEPDAEKPETDAAETVPGEESLGDPGKKALDAMKAERKAALDRAKDAEARADAMTAKLEGREKEYEAEQAARKVEGDALAKANQRILSAEVRSAAKGKMQNPELVGKLIDTTDFEVGSDGEVDASAINAAIDGLIAQYPALAVQDGRRFTGTPDSGVRNAPPAQLSANDLDNMSATEINQARRDGRLDNIR